MNWTQEKPTEEGHYLLARPSDFTIELVEVFQSGYKSRESQIAMDYQRLSPRKEDWWFGPIDNVIPDPWDNKLIRAQAGWKIE